MLSVKLKVFVPHSNDQGRVAGSEEQAVVRRAQGGDAEAVAQLYHNHALAIFRYFLFRMPDRETAEDLTGEVFLKMVESLPRYVDRGLPFAAWLFRIAHDRAVDHHRRSAVRQTEELDEQLPDGQADTEAVAAQGVESRRVQQLIRELTDDQRLVVQLRFVEGMSLEETAILLGKSLGAIKALQHRALRQLGQRLVD